MTIIEEIEEKNDGIVNIDYLRDYIRELIKEKYKDTYEVNDCFLFMTECLVFRGLSHYDLKSLEKEDVNLILSIMKDTDSFKENIEACDKGNIIYVLWNCLYNYIDFECFRFEEKDLERMKKITMYLSKVLDYYEIFESGNLTDVALENVSVYELKLAIGEFLEVMFTNELN